VYLQSLEVWYGTSTSSGSAVNGEVEERNDESGWEKRVATSAVFRIGWEAVYKRRKLNRRY
jgi:hypothetical protein